MPAERAPLCHGLAVMTGVLTYLGGLAIEGLATGELARAFAREAVDVGAYWYFGLPVCYLVAGALGYLGRVRSWRWSLDMLATHSVCMLLFAGSGLNLWPIALVFALVLALPGMLTAWLGARVYRFRTALHEVER
jgi:Na+-translocating ferredoxin:NAD+ oxidoreductase RnfD subunit